VERKIPVGEYLALVIIGLRLPLNERWNSTIPRIEIGEREMGYTYEHIKKHGTKYRETNYLLYFTFTEIIWHCLMTALFMMWL